MSTQPCFEPVCTGDEGTVALQIVPRPRDLGGFSVRRVLPSADRQMVGPFIFFDEMGPAVFPPGEGIDVRPHPHIGIATITYLFDGEIMHQDSLGYEQPIRPGALGMHDAAAGAVGLNGVEYQAGTMVVFSEGADVSLATKTGAHVMVVGGAPVGDRTIWWNFVSSSKERIDQAKDDWREGRFDGVDGDEEFIPLPER